MHQVLLPGAPLFLAHVADGYDVTIHEARLVFLLCCMSLVFGNVFPALGHLVVLILCMVKKHRSYCFCYFLCKLLVPGGKTST